MGFNMVINVGRLDAKNIGDARGECTFVMNLLYLCHPWIIPGEILGTAMALTCCVAASPISYLLQPDS